MLKHYSYANKTKRIKIYKEVEKSDGIIKEYIHPHDVMIKAYVRQLSGNEQNTLDSIQNRADIEFVINARDISIDMFVEFKDKVYAIDGDDNLEFDGTEMHLRGYPITPKTYIETRWT
ncbi:MAG: head-tail adaptor protein [Bacteroidales bacterium]|jgi:head-tail adaptor|nr:head-tail adaptor protein [Bacteroidales bacterium]